MKKSFLKNINTEIMKDKVTIGYSDYKRELMETGKIGWTIGDDTDEFLSVIQGYEKNGYKVVFKTNIIRRIFGLGIYKVIAYVQ